MFFFLNNLCWINVINIINIIRYRLELQMLIDLYETPSKRRFYFANKNENREHKSPSNRHNKRHRARVIDDSIEYRRQLHSPWVKRERAERNETMQNPSWSDQGLAAIFHAAAWKNLCPADWSCSAVYRNLRATFWEDGFWKRDLRADRGWEVLMDFYR